MATKGRKRVAVLMAVLPLVAATRLPALSGGTQFRVKYEVGTPAIKQGAPVRVKFEPRFIICEAKKGLSFSIPTAGITEVGHDSIPWSRSKALLRKGLYGYGQGIGALYDMALLAVAGALLPFGGEDHFVHIAWNWDGSDEVVWFELSKDRYAAFLQELERATGKKALDLSTEREEKQHELLDKAETVEIRLDRKVWVAGKTLKPGRYQLVLLERNETTGEQFFPEQEGQAQTSRDRGRCGDCEADEQDLFSKGDIRPV